MDFMEESCECNRARNLSRERRAYFAAACVVLVVSGGVYLLTSRWGAPFLPPHEKSLPPSLHINATTQLSRGADADGVWVLQPLEHRPSIEPAVQVLQPPIVASAVSIIKQQHSSSNILLLSPRSRVGSTALLRLLVRAGGVTSLGEGLRRAAQHRGLDGVRSLLRQKMTTAGNSAKLFALSGIAAVAAVT